MTKASDNGGQYPESYREFARLFNNDEFWESHEALEHQWIEEDRSNPFLQGLIIFAAAYEQVKRGNPRGGRLNWLKSRRYLERYRPHHEGVNVDAMIRHIDRCLEAVEAKEAFGTDNPLDSGEVPRWTMTFDARQPT